MSEEKTPESTEKEPPHPQTPGAPDGDAEASNAEGAEASKAESTHAAEATSEGSETTSDAKDDAKDAKKATGVDDIARRAFALGEDDAAEKFARDEEAKLAERRAEAKKAKKKGSLEASASKKLSDIGTKKAAKKKAAAEEEEDDDVAVPAKAYADPLLERTTRLTTWASKNQKTVGYLVAAAVVGLVGSFAYMHFKQQKEGEASAELVSAVTAQRGKIGEAPKDDDGASGPFYKTAQERTDDALKKYKDVQSKYPGTGAAILARLAEGSVHLDKRESDAALTAFTEVKNSALALADKEVKGRALEGIGLAQEQKAQLKESFATFKELESTVEIAGFKEMAIYHQARISEAMGEKDKAKELLLSLRERINKPEQPPMSYLKEVVDERLRAIDPKSVPAEDPMNGLMNGLGGGPGGGKISPEVLKRIRNMKPPGGGGGHP